jgi:hypothetical protein
MWHVYQADMAYYEGRADGLLASARDGTPTAVEAFGGAPLTPEGAREVIARRHGEEDWETFRAALPRLLEGPFAQAYRAIEAHDADLLGELATPELVTAVGTNGNDLLNMATASCDERLVDLLLARGADPGRPTPTAGRRCTRRRI